MNMRTKDSNTHAAYGKLPASVNKNPDQREAESCRCIKTKITVGLELLFNFNVYIGCERYSWHARALIHLLLPMYAEIAKILLNCKLCQCCLSIAKNKYFNINKLFAL